MANIRTRFRGRNESSSAAAASVLSSRAIKVGFLCLLAFSMGILTRDMESNMLTISTDSIESIQYLLSTDSTTTSNSSPAPDGRPSSLASTAGNDRLKKSAAPPTSASSMDAKKKAQIPKANIPNAAAAPPPLNFIPNDQLNLHDYFSDSWLLNRENFLRVPLSEIGIVEDACFAAIGKSHIHKRSKMFVDWTEFMVMHLSKWWVELGILEDPDPTMFDHTLSIFQTYLNRVATSTTSTTTTTTSSSSSSSPSNSPLHPTIAVIAFAPYNSRQDFRRGPQLTAHSLAATIASLYQVGFGRVVVTGYNESDQDRVYDAFRLLKRHIMVDNDDNKDDETDGGGAVGGTKSTTTTHHTNTDVPTKIGRMELAYVKIVDPSWLKTRWVQFNMPRAAVIGMQSALGPRDGRHKYRPEEEEEAKTVEREWLGTTHDPSYWKYVYLTEPDTLLHTKPNIWKLIQQGLDDGLSFFPHRLQPLPHEENLPPAYSFNNNNNTAAINQINNNNNKKHISDMYAGRFLPNIHPFSNITTLDDDDDDSMHCCDDTVGKWPGRSVEFGIEQRPCNGHWWWACGYSKDFKVAELTTDEILDHHKRLVLYPMLRMDRRGTGIIFGPTEMGRRCFPSKTPCPKQP
eukprot:scaffold3267_cov140-Cylindrotheca_fusiformis.AAC.15